MNLHQKIKSVIAKAHRVVEKNHTLLSKNQELENEIRLLKQALQNESKNTSELNNQIKIIKLARNIGSANSDNADARELKKKINEYIKEIDHCISILSD